MDINIKWITPASGSGAGSRIFANGVRLGTSKGAGGKPQSCITIYAPFMKELRIMGGDRVAIGDAGDYIAMRRTTSGGYAVGPTGDSGEIRKKKFGTACTSVVKFNSDLVRASHYVSREELIILDDGTVLIPKSPQLAAALP